MTQCQLSVLQSVCVCLIYLTFLKLVALSGVGKGWVEEEGVRFVLLGEDVVK